MQIDMAGSDLASVHVPSFIEQSPTKKANQTGNSSARLLRGGLDCTANTANGKNYCTLRQAQCSTLKTLYLYFLLARQRENAFPQCLHCLALLLVERAASQ